MPSRVPRCGAAPPAVSGWGRASVVMSMRFA
jgi:hypothetical protein